MRPKMAGSPRANLRPVADGPPGTSYRRTSRRSSHPATQRKTVFDACRRYAQKSGRRVLPELGSYTNPVLRAGGAVLIMRGIRKQVDETSLPGREADFRPQRRRAILQW